MCGEVGWASSSSDEPKRLVWVCGEPEKQKITPDKPKRLVWMCGEARQAQEARVGV
jgi:hypothetical protein